MKTLTRKKLLKAVVFRTTDGYKATIRMNAVYVPEFIEKLTTVIPPERIRDIHIVDRLKATPLDKSKDRRWGTYWCPYCAEFRRFVPQDHGYLGCEICEISDADYHVKIYNRLKDGIHKTYESPEAAAKAAKRAERRLKRKRKKGA